MLRKLKRWLDPLAATPLHPQWLSRAGAAHLRKRLQAIPAGARVLDVGCSDRWPRAWIHPEVRYVGLDYLSTARDWYGSVPDVYGDALRLPVADGTVDVVLLLDVLEHISDSDSLMRELSRVLAKDGRIIAQVPFLYPLHDEPRDFVRLTRHGFEVLAGGHGFELRECRAVGHPLETAALAGNLALGKTALSWLSRGNPALLLLPLVPLAWLISNLAARLLARLSPADDFMPFSYQLVLTRKNVA